MKYGRTAWLTAQGLGLIGAVGYGLLIVKERFVVGTHAISPTVFVVLMCGTLGAAYGFASQRILREIRRVQGGETSL